MGKVFKAVVPTNIALVKYWGKKDAREQIPANSSLSMTLSDWHTICEVEKREASAREHRFQFISKSGEREVSPNEGFGRKIFPHLERILRETGFSGRLSVRSANSFPTGCGVASSASGLGSLTLAALAATLDTDSLSALRAAGWEPARVASLARMGSGSACRSFFGGFVSWSVDEGGETQQLRQLFSDDWWRLSDTLIIFSEDEKKTSSSEAHKAAWSSPLFALRLAGIPDKCEAVQESIRERNILKLGPLLEQEAMEMHSIMLTSQPPECYLNKEALDFLSDFRRFRRKSGVRLWFTIDAGTNIHILGESGEPHSMLDQFIQKDYPQLRTMRDTVGPGPELSSFMR